MVVRQLKGISGIGKRVILCLFLLLLFFNSMAQTRSFMFDIRSAAYKGLQLYSEGNYAAAVPMLEQAVRNPKNRAHQPLLLGLAHSYAVTGAARSAAEWYSLLKERGFELEGEHKLLYANALMGSGQLEEGRKNLMEFLLSSGNESQIEALTNQSMADFYRDSIRYSVAPVSINSEAAEFSPVIVPYGILFVAERPKAGLVQNRFSADESNGLDVFYGRITDGGDVNQIVRLNDLVSSQMPEGPVAVAQNGKKLFYTRSGNKGEMKIFQARSIFNFTTWFDEEPVTLPIKGSLGHPATTENGQVLYFISDMPGGMGGTDIYKVERTKKGWSEPRNLGPKVNTAGNELFPVLHGADKLYYASNGHFGLGGLDIYEASLQGDSVLSVRNLGAPVNSEGDDFGLSLHGSGTWGYFSSNRAGGAGKDDIYRLDVHIIKLAGKVYDKTNGKTLSKARVSLYQDDVLLQETVSDKSGLYSFQLYPGQEYELRYSVDEFRDFSERFSTRQGASHGTRKWETGLDRKVKMFVLGTIKNSSKRRASDAVLLVIEEETGRKDTILADSRGNYEMELDAYHKYVFWSSCDQEAAVATFSTPERGKASLSYYVDIELKPSVAYKVRGLVKSRDGEKGPFVISRLNKLTMEQDYILTDERGNFTFEAHSVEEYELCLLHEKSPAPVFLTPGWTQPERTVLICL